MVIIKWWGSTNAVDTEKLVFRHEFPEKRFCKMEKLREALGDIFGSDDWVVEYDGHNLIIKVGSRVDLKEELKARGIIYKSMSPEFRRFSVRRTEPRPNRLGAQDTLVEAYPIVLYLCNRLPFHHSLRVRRARHGVASLFNIVQFTRQFEMPSLPRNPTNPSSMGDALPRRLLTPRSSPHPTIRRAYHDWSAITSVALLSTTRHASQMTASHRSICPRQQLGSEDQEGPAMTIQARAKCVGCKTCPTIPVAFPASADNLDPLLSTIRPPAIVHDRACVLDMVPMRTQPDDTIDSNTRSSF
ncbi:hypothetical protein FNAPI_1730 [Fusarium napiforme]|uniref:Uncharacterized protein n=1 Tax=Fusarium napiforme TaxID=42672 RepID=A0A8H5NG22_9HYPO|nr:hypothetical protein FNAPI_1730 [Fusarium napiforme]